MKLQTKHFFLYFPGNKVRAFMFPGKLIPGINFVSVKQTPPKNMDSIFGQFQDHL
jgi:hypothetical protein